MVHGRTETPSDIRAMGRGLVKAELPYGEADKLFWIAVNMRYVIECMLEDMEA